MKTFTRVEPTDVVVVGDAFKRDVVIKRFRTEDGLTHEFTTFFAEHDQAVQVFALTTSGEIITVYQFRPGQERWVYEIPGGGVETNEDLRAAAEREFREETGYIPGSMDYLGRCFDSGYVNVRQHVFYARDCYLDESPHAQDTEERDQGSELKLMPVEALMELAAAGDTCYGSAIVMGFLRYLKENKEV